ncbi:hypothetical protein V6N11_048194 [Hibiscus sabdariffa]|uniref:Uncharacterized protein n=1 Tax=Hibiscus sabdariffa TaxID=183260 RepID=A0ABR2ABY7_9ROSI
MSLMERVSFELRVFYVRISKFESDDEYLTLNHVPSSHDTLRDVNGVRTGINSNCLSTILRRDWVYKRSEEAVFVSTDSIRLTGSVKFEVFDKDSLLLYGALGYNSCTEDSRGSGMRWSMDCENVMAKQFPTVEVYVAGSSMGSPIILTRILRPSLRTKQTKAVPVPDSIPEFEDEDGEEHSMFNAGVKVGLGIGFSICVGIGISVGLLIRTFQGTTIPNFPRRF